MHKIFDQLPNQSLMSLRKAQYTVERLGFHITVGPNDGDDVLRVGLFGDVSVISTSRMMNGQHTSRAIDVVVE